MPNAPWATANTGPNPSDLYPEPPQGQYYGGAQTGVAMQPGVEPIYDTYTDADGISHSVIVGYRNVQAAAASWAQDKAKLQSMQGGQAGGTDIENRQMLDQLRSVLLGDPATAQQTLASMGWTGTVDQFKALTPAQQNVWAHEHAVATRDTVPTRYGWNSMYGGFYRDPNTGVVDFTKW
jgi:hypothetical protein